jgi:hypothetical protein
MKLLLKLHNSDAPEKARTGRSGPVLGWRKPSVNPLGLSLVEIVEIQAFDEIAKS